MVAKILVASVSFCNFSIKQKPGEILKEAGIEIDISDKGKALTETELLSVIEKYDGIIVGTDPMTPKVIQEGKNLKIIAKNGVGYDNIDLKAATAQHVYVTFTPGAVEQTVADSTFAMIFALARNIVLGNIAVRKGEWPRIIGTDVSKKKLGIIGLGRIGKNVVMRSTGFNMDVYAYDPLIDAAFCEKYGVYSVDLDTVFKTCDIVTVHAPLMESTRHIVNQRTLSLMKPDSILINTARGELVDEQALYDALKEKKIAGAAIDVFSKEPPARDNPLFELENIILTPHIAGYSSDTLLASGMMVAESIVATLKGEIPPYVVNKELISK
ncbi:MAG TPA: phosphoglycerate dehydrogenase [Anaerolineaceae bacterium]|nr:phosphoglycerate dehydrogenase [Anaerolineaceae bacterium]